MANQYSYNNILNYLLSMAQYVHSFPPPPSGPLVQQIAAPQFETHVLPIWRQSPNNVSPEPLREVIVKCPTPIFSARATAPRLPMIPHLSLEK